jgi:hypothetical protein
MRESVRHAAEVVAPYAGSAKQTAACYAGRYTQEARKALTPMVAAAADQARGAAIAQYDARLAPRIAQVRGAVPPGLTASTAAAAEHTRRTARQMAEFAAPRMEQVMASALSATEPVREEAAARAGAALAALRGQVSAEDVRKLVRRNERRAQAGRTTKRFVVMGVVTGAAIAVWRWWNRQANPEWLIEPPSATEPAEDERMTPGSVASPTRTTVDDASELTDEAGLDPRLRAASDDEEAQRGRRRGRHGGDSHG